ncbi:MAG: hypothetical protein PVG39_23290 [Desulfobacteraceae bacterium]|jgi:hypothetical protein
MNGVRYAAYGIGIKNGAGLKAHGTGIQEKSVKGLLKCDNMMTVSFKTQVEEGKNGQYY